MDKLHDFYSEYHDEIYAKRFASPYALRRYVHGMQYKSIADLVESGERVLDAGCGEGVLSVILAQKGAVVVGCDLSVPNVERARDYAKEVGAGVTFEMGDAGKLPYPDRSFDVAVSSHVLEHLPDFDAGIRELLRVSKGRVILAVPTALSWLSFVQLGGGWFYLKGVRSFAAFFIGITRVVWAWCMGRDGVDETYAGSGMPHVFRFPEVVRKHIQAAGGTIELQEASTLALPYFASLLPVSSFLDRFRRAPLLRSWGYGTTFVIIVPGDTGASRPQT